jgi:hypothetical protein
MNGFKTKQLNPNKHHPEKNPFPQPEKWDFKL